MTASVESRVDLQPDPSLPRWATDSVEWLMGALLVAGPLTFGATESWGQSILLALITLMAIATLAGHFTSRNAPRVRTWAYLPIAIILLIGLAQLIPLPTTIRMMFMPGATALRSEIMGMAGLDASGKTPASLYPLATERQLRLLLGGAMLFLIVLHVYVGNADRRRRLLRTITVVGLAMALLAIGQYGFDAQTILGLAARNHPYSATFANHSHFGQFMNLSIGAAATLLIGDLRAMRASGTTWRGIRDDVLRDPGHWDIWVATATVALGPIAILISLTRGGVLSLCAGAFVASMLLALTSVTRHRRRGGDAPIIALLTIAAVLLVVVAVAFNAAYDRMASLRHVEQSSGGRHEIIRDALDVWRSSPWIGTGLGTHAFVFPAFDRSAIGSWASHAENEYVQLLEETGALGFGAVALLVLLVAGAIVRGTVRIRRSTRQRGSSVSRAELPLPGLALGLTAVTLHSASDFGQHVPAVAFLTAITCALVFAMDRDGIRTSAGPSAAAQRPRNRVGQGILVVMSIALVGAIAAIAPRLQQDRRAEAAFWDASIQRGLLDASGWSIEAPAYTELLRRAKEAHEAQPRDVEYTFWLNAWRWEAIAQQADPASPTLDPQLAGWTQQLINELLSTIGTCPTFGRPLAFAGQLIEQLPDRTAMSVANASAMASRGAELAPYDPLASFTAGRMAAASGDRERASRLLTRAAAIGWPKAEVVAALINELDDVPAARAIAGSDLDSLDRFIGVLSKRPKHAAELASVTVERDALIDRMAGETSTNAATLDQLAARFMAAGQNDRAIDCMSRACAADYGNVDRRMRLAELLAGVDKLDQAIDQAKIASRFRTGDVGITQRIEQWKATLRDRARRPTTNE